MSSRNTTRAEFAQLSVAPPTPTGETQPFWDAVRQGKLLVQLCRACGRAQNHPRRRCMDCWGNDLAWSEATGLATIVTHTEVQRPGHTAWAAVAPYVVALVRLDEGPVMLTHLLVDGVTPRVGDQCAFEPTVVGEWTLPFFRLS